MTDGQHDRHFGDGNGDHVLDLTYDSTLTNAKVSESRERGLTTNMSNHVGRQARDLPNRPTSLTPSDRKSKD